MPTLLSTTVDEYLRRRGLRAVLREVERADLERLRLHRNDPDVRRWLEDDREVTPEQQQSWFFVRGHAGFRIVRLEPVTALAERRHTGSDDDLDVGIARLGPGPVVGCDAFAEHRGSMGAVVLEMACRHALDAGLRPELWTFVANARGVALYESAGFRWCSRTDLRWFLRDFGDGPVPRAYGRMIRA